MSSKKKVNKNQMASKKKVEEIVINLLHICKLYKEKHNELPIIEGYKVIFKKDFVFEWVKLTAQERKLLKEKLKNEK